MSSETSDGSYSDAASSSSSVHDSNEESFVSEDRREMEDMAGIKRKRGRPRKHVVVTATTTTTTTEKRKRGRPRKNPASINLQKQHDNMTQPTEDDNNNDVDQDDPENPTALPLPPHIVPQPNWVSLSLTSRRVILNNTRSTIRDAIMHPELADVKHERPKLEEQLNRISNQFREGLISLRVPPIQNKDRKRNKYDNLDQQVADFSARLKLARFVHRNLRRNIEADTALQQELTNDVHELQTHIVDAPMLPRDFLATSDAWLKPSDNMSRHKVLRALPPQVTQQPPIPSTTAVEAFLRAAAIGLEMHGT